MKLYAYSRTMAGAQRLAQQRGGPVPTIEPRKPEPAPDSAPVVDNVVRLVIPRTEAQQIVAEVAHQNGFTYAEVLSPSRRRKLVQARHDAIAAVKTAKPMITLEQLGRLFRRDYSSIRHALVQRGLA